MIEQVLGHQVDMQLDEGDVVTGVVVLAQVQRVDDNNNNDSLLIGVSDSTGGIVSDGLIFRAYQVAAGSISVRDPE